ncbi:hypothetical protein [Bradyrhizobium elkanii]|uniref:hypothetical protein n=1 Tax=Bradyrhizobium elkanii TaxID=29448 RepID=UPI003D1E31D2
MTWSTWLAWVLVSASVPVFCTIAASAIGKPVTRSAGYPKLIVLGLFLLVAFSLIAPPLMQGFVLKRVLPRLSVTAWFFCILLSAVLWFVLAFGEGVTLIQAGARIQRQLQLVAESRMRAGTFDIFSLPWTSFLQWVFMSSAVTSLIPSLALGMASRRRGATMIFLIAAIVAALVSAVVELLYGLSYDRHLFKDWAAPLNGLSWIDRVHVLIGRAGIGAVWGATTAIAMVLVTRLRDDTSAPSAWTFAIHRRRRLACVLCAPLLFALLAPFAGYLAGPRGLVAGAPELRRTVSPTPSKDSSQGEAVLTYSHDVALSIAPTSAVRMAPDGQSAIVRTADNALVQVDIATGRSLRQLAGPLDPYDRYAIAWSPDGRYLALRSGGAASPIPNTNYRHRDSRVRLYALPDLSLAGEFAGSEQTCFESDASESLMFSADSGSLWLICSQYLAPKPDDPIAIRIEVPAMRMRDVRRYGAGNESGLAHGLKRIGDAVWACQSPYSRKPFRIYDLTHGRQVVTVSMPLELIGNLTSQTAGSCQLDENSIRHEFCGIPPRVPAGAAPASSICRTLTFDTRTGSLIGSVDAGDRRAPFRSPGRPNSVTSDRGLSVEAFWQENSKAGEIVVRDSATGRERQRIVAVAQRPLQMSSDGRWLMTVTIYGNALRLYRVNL